MRRIYLSSLIILLLLAASSKAFDGKRKGFILGGGLGVGPYARVSVNGADGNWDHTGLGFNLLIGYAWDERNMLVYLRDIVLYLRDIETGLGASTDLQALGFLGVGYFHYFGPVGRSAYFCVGLGHQDGFSEFAEHTYSHSGLGFLVGGGYEFARHIQAHASASFGRTEGPDDDYNHMQIVVTVSAVAF